MIYNEENGTFLFGYTTIEDCGSQWDEWYETEEEALESSRTVYGVERSEWNEIPNPEPHCQHDWIQPIRVIGRERGQPEFGRLEMLINGEWIEIKVAE